MAQVSVIIPVYNCEKYIQNCIESILNQTYSDYELILVDDGSTDLSGKVCDEFAQKDRRIVVVHKENGGGAGEARNYGLSIASSPFICFVDSDDWIQPIMLETLMTAQSKRNYDVVICGYCSIPEDKNSDRGIPTYYKAENFHNNGEVIEFFTGKYPEGMVGYPWNKLYKKIIIDKYHIEFPKMRRLEDGIFNVEYFEHAESCCILQDILYNYRISQQVEKRKLPLDFYSLIEKFVLHYYKKLKKWDRFSSETEKPMVFYFLNDFVCCLENIFFCKDDISFKNRKRMLVQLHEKKLVKYMLKKERNIPRYSQIVLCLFEKKRYVLLSMVIHLKILLKTKLNRLFQMIKRVAN